MTQMNLQNQNIVDASSSTPSGTNAEDDVILISIPHQPMYIQIQEGHYNGNDPKSNSLSSQLSNPVCPTIRSNDQWIGAVRNSDDITSTIPEPQICRICAFEEEEEDKDVLVELGCSCKGEMSKMHRKCILKWFGGRMLLEKLYTCELCNTTLHTNAQLIVAQGVTDHENGGRAILMNALKSSLVSYAPHIEVELAANYKELEQLLLVERAEWYRHQGHADVHIDTQDANSNLEEEEVEPITVSFDCGRDSLTMIMSVGATLVSMGLYTYIFIYLFGSIGYN